MKTNQLPILLFCLACLMACTKELAPLGSAVFTVQNGGCEASCEVTFSAPGGSTRYRWDFDDGTTTTGQTAKKTYANAGNYRVKLIVSGDGGSAISSQTVNIRQKAAPAPVASFSFSGTNNFIAPCTVNFTNTSTNANSHAWDFGVPGATSTQTSPSFSYTAAGSYTVRLTSTGAGSTNTAQQTVTITAPVVVPNTREYLPGVAFSKMVLVNGGTFQMGDTRNEGESEEKPVHSVTVSSFYMGQYEVTQRQWQNVIGSNPAGFTGCDDCPVEQVSHDDIQTFLSKLNQQRPANTPAFRLPTEAEWEYAAGGGAIANRTRFGNGKDIANINEMNFYGLADGKASYSEVGVYRQKTTQVGSFAPNALGLYDMSGNVWEWCSDWYGAYSSTAQTNPTGPGSGTYRALRGGCWYDLPQNCRSARRYGITPSLRLSGSGLRVVSQSQ